MVFSDDVTFVHSDGRAEGKTDYIKAMTAGDTSYEGVKTAKVEAKQVTPDVIVLIGAQEMRKKLGPDWSGIKLRFMSVWRNESGTWRMIAWQSLRPAGNSVVPKKYGPVGTYLRDVRRSTIEMLFDVADASERRPLPAASLPRRPYPQSDSITSGRRSARDRFES